MQSRFMLIFIAVAVAGCSSSAKQLPDASGSDAASVERGPKDIMLDGDPNGLWWDQKSQTLYIADSDNNRILKWTDAAGFGAPAMLPAAPPDGPDLGQVVELSGGTLLVTQFGFGSSGALVFSKPGGATGTVANLDTLRRRIGLTVSSSGDLFDTFFVKLNNGQVGSIGKVSLDGSESQFLTGLQKPVGVLAVGDNLYVSDQDLSQVWKVPIANPSAHTVFADQIDSPDLLSEGPDGTMFTGAVNGAVNQIAADGSFHVFASGFRETRGTAYDPAHRRLFVADHDPSSTAPVPLLHILPVN
jgi:hypothetical protein